VLVFDIALFSLFSFCKLLLNGAIFKLGFQVDSALSTTTKCNILSMYLYDIIKVQFPKSRASSMNMFLVVLVPFFLTVMTSAVLWSYQILTAPATSSNDLIVHYDLTVNKNRTTPTTPIIPPDASDTPSLSRDVYLVSSYHFMCVQPKHIIFNLHHLFFALPPPPPPPPIPHSVPARWQQSYPHAALSAPP
jgi:hypothetical protein